MIQHILQTAVLTILFAISSQAALLTTYTWTTSNISYNLEWTLVTDDDTPEWAKLPNARHWVMLSDAIQFSNAPGLLLVLRAVQYLDNANTTWWMDVHSLSGDPADPVGSTSDTPEPGTMALIAAALTGLAIRRLRQSSTRRIPPAPLVNCQLGSPPGPGS
ncbi:MAG: PEP-CTERM sorting domain-containing protein [Bryobacterales bacterium]|nr:PEP-CTERM sorting domain-containing protein [Bryobacterales bacterium]